MKNFIRISPCDDQKGNFGSGFFSNYRSQLNDLIYVYENLPCLTPYIYWGNTAWVEGYNPFNGDILIEKENPFDFWFDQDIPTYNDVYLKNSHKNKFNYLLHNQDYFYDKNNLNKQREVEKKYLKLKSHIKDKIDKIYSDEFNGNTMLGVLARGCEFLHHHPEYGKFTIDDYIKKIKEVLNQKPEINKIFIVSEDSNYVNILKDAFPSSYFMENVFRRTDETLEYMNRVYLWPNVDTKRKDQNRLLGEETIVQTKLLGKCDYLLGMHTGVFCGAVLWGENIKEIFKLR